MACLLQRTGVSKRVGRWEKTVENIIFPANGTSSGASDDLRWIFMQPILYTPTQRRLGTTRIQEPILQLPQSQTWLWMVMGQFD